MECGFYSLNIPIYHDLPILLVLLPMFLHHLDLALPQMIHDGLVLLLVVTMLVVAMLVVVLLVVDFVVMVALLVHVVVLLLLV
jgi:hypothetical protein